MTALVLTVMLALRTLSALSSAALMKANRRAQANYTTSAKVERVLFAIGFDACLVALYFTTGHWQFAAMPAVGWAVAIVAGLASRDGTK